VKFVNEPLTQMRQAGSVNIETETRELTVEVAHNIRHLGGYRTRNCSRTISNDIVRSATLHRLTDRGVETIAEAGIRTIIDFRSEMELEREKTPDVTKFGIRSIHAPVFRSTDASPAGLADKEFPGYGFVYQRFLEIGGQVTPVELEL
jgi:protein-tyrosine phosphatase